MSQWEHQYRALSEPDRRSLNDLVNELFQRRTGFRGKINPRAQPELAAKWIAIRDGVLANRHRFTKWLGNFAAGAQAFAAAAMVYQTLDTVPGWIRTARGQIGVHEIKGSKHDPRIMDYIRTCENVQGTAAQRRFVEREGEEGVEWCSAFVNWCLRQNGITGTNHAAASSWKHWGTELSGPKRGAIVGFKWQTSTGIAHVAFCDEENGRFYMLGGNQTDGDRSGGQVSRRPLPTSNARFYRWPAGMRG